MTVTKDISLLCSFKAKIDEAASYVPRMHAADKIKAVQFWNLVSEKLQDIVNNSSADINSVTVKATESEYEKLHLHVNNSRPANVVPNCSISSDFTNLPSSYALNSEIIEQYHPVGNDNSQLLTSEAFSIVTESSLNNISIISHFNPLNNSMNSSERNISDNYITVDSLSENNCDALVLNPCISSTSKAIESVLEESIKSNDYIPKEISHNDSNIYKSPEVTEELSGHSCKINTLVTHNPVLIKLGSCDRDENGKASVSKLFMSKDKNCDKFKSQIDDGEHEINVTDDSECSKDSVKSDLGASMSAGESDSSHPEREPIVSFVVSCSEEILAKNDLTPDLNEKCSDECTGRNCSHLKPYKCSDCSAKFASKGNLVVHMRKHTGEKPYSCSKCSSCFTTKGNLKRHARTHTGEKPFECELCRSKFTEKKSLNVHMRRHTGEKPYECKDCGKRFAQSGILHSHMAMHLNLKFHLCEHCGKSFRQKSQLHIHKLRHENIRKHACSLCSARFLTKGDLERHMRVHTGERPFVCDVCPRKFTRQQSLNEHMNRHYGLRPYVCKYCSKAFTEMSACYKHIKQHERTASESSETSQAASSTEITKLSEESSHNISNSSSLEMLSVNKDDLLKTEAEDDDELSPKDEAVDGYIENFIV